MQNLLDHDGFFKAKAPARAHLYKCFCTRCDADFYSANRYRKLCKICAGPAATREVQE